MNLYLNYLAGRRFRGSERSWRIALIWSRFENNLSKRGSRFAKSRPFEST